MPARRIFVSPQGGGFGFIGATLPMAFQSIAYSQDISGQARSGTPAYSFTLISASGGDSWSVTAAGVINGTPAVELYRVTNTGAVRSTNTGILRVT